MTEKEIKVTKNMGVNSPEVPANQKSELADQKLITIKGILTSSIQVREEKTKEPYYYAFVRIKGQSVDLPVIFKVKDDQENLTNPPLKKSDEVELTGHYSNSEKSVRKSFTATSYQVFS
jgi:hypothetical protein